jgi:hypothetical protein
LCISFKWFMIIHWWFIMKGGHNIAGYAVYNTVILQICVCTSGCISRNCCVWIYSYVDFLNSLYKYTIV